MKKKGLIISTVVMVVVLVASLTTATFAWFTTTASAAVENLDVQTTAAQGLQIGLYSPSSNITSYTSGTATIASRDGSADWKGSEGTSWGSTVDFSSNLQEGVGTYMAVSGDGFSMYALNAPDEAGIDGAPGEAGDEAYKADDSAVVRDAVANQDYFSAYIALLNTTDKAQDVVINGINVTAKANNNGYTGMAASLRIAVFATTSAPADRDAFKANLKHVVAPFGNLKYNAKTAVWAENSSAATDVTAYLKAKEAGYTTKVTTLSGMDKGSAVLTGWHPMTASEAKNVQPVTDKLAEKTELDLATGLTAKTGIVYLMLVVWFEGQDQECINLFAGGGASIGLNFGFKAAGAGA